MIPPADQHVTLLCTGEPQIWWLILWLFFQTTLTGYKHSEQNNIPTLHGLGRGLSGARIVLSRSFPFHIGSLRTLHSSAGRENTGSPEVEHLKGTPSPSEAKGTCNKGHAEALAHAQGLEDVILKIAAQLLPCHRGKEGPKDQVGLLQPTF